MLVLIMATMLHDDLAIIAIAGASFGFMVIAGAPQTNYFEEE